MPKKNRNQKKTPQRRSSRTKTTSVMRKYPSEMSSEDEQENITLGSKKVEVKEKVIIPNKKSLEIELREALILEQLTACLLYTSPSPRDRTRSRMPSSA